MPSWLPVSPETCRSLFWQPASSLAFAARSPTVPLVLAEIPRAALSLPIAFVRSDGAPFPVALLALDAEDSLLIAPDGRWLGPYVPAALRAHPFALLRVDGTDRMVLCVDRESGLVSDSEGEAFFGPDGSLSPALARTLEFLSKVEQDRHRTLAAAALLDQAGVLAPWTITVRTDAGEKRLEGLWRVDEAALDGLAPDAFADLRRHGALKLGLCQVLSMQNLERLSALARAREAERKRAAEVFAASFIDPAREETVFDWSLVGEAEGQG